MPDRYSGAAGKRKSVVYGAIASGEQQSLAVGQV